MTVEPVSAGAMVREMLRHTFVVACGWMLVSLSLATLVLTVFTLADASAAHRTAPLIVAGLLVLAGADAGLAGVALAGPVRGWWRGRPQAARWSLLCAAGVLAIWVSWVFVDVAAYSAT
jgi:hypothetical protein